MGMKHSWLTWLLLAGLVVVFTGARVLEGIEWLHLPLIIVGGAAVFTAAVWRVAVWRGAQGEGRSVEAVFALGYAGCALALAGYVPGTEGGLELLGLEFEGVRDEIRFRRFFLVASPILLGASLLPVLGAQWALAKGGTRGALLVDAMRVRETVANTLSVALAGSALMLVGYIASALNQTADFSYFKTATPGESVREIVRNMDGTLDAALFFPEVNAVKDEVRNYLDELSRATGKVTIAEYDRYANPEAAADYNARSDDGQLFLRFDGRTEQIGFLLDLDDARGRLRILDSYVQQALLQLNRSRRFAYLTKGHGEFNDPISADEPEPDEPPSLREPWRPGMENEFDQGPPPRVLREMLDFLNYEVRDIGIGEGLGERIPDDAAMVMILGPQHAFLDAEINSIRDYLDRGGSLLVAMEPGSEFQLEELRDDLGVEYNPAMTIDDQRFLPGSPPTIADRRFIITNRFSTHPSVTTASRSGNEIVLIGPGSFTVADSMPGLRTNLIINSLPSSYADLNGDYRFDEGTEVQDGYGLAAAIERVGIDAAADSANPETPEDTRQPGMRALLYGDAEMFADQVLAFPLNRFVVADGIQWLGGEEDFAGEVVSEEDVPIQHTQSENVAWFYAIIFGAPAVVMGVGVFILYGRRKVAPGEPESEESSS
ncbi:MAG: Gldg family protein [Gemmatimonadota bacterium]|nr:Gldg family protein [Gemmatimonadota bacterium]MDE2866575.1 Gldg family protein [Gemmatimonadota bacterium]